LSHASRHYDPNLSLNFPNGTGELVEIVTSLIQVHTMTLHCLQTHPAAQVGERGWYCLSYSVTGITP